AAPAVKFVKRPVGSAWLAPETVDSSETLNNSTGDQGPSIALTKSGTPYVLWVSPGPNVFIRIKYRSASGWVSDNPTTNLYTHAPQVYTQNDDIYAFLGHDSQIRFGYDYQLAGQSSWAPYRNLTTTADGQLDGSADIRWDPPRDNNPGVIDAAFFDEDKYDDGRYITELYYMAVLPSGASGGGGGDVTPPVVSVSSPVGGSTVSGVVGLSASASDDVGVIGVQFRLDGVNVGAEVLASPFSGSWDSRLVADVSHVVSAAARVAAGYVATSSVTVTVSNGGSPPPPPSGLVAAWGFNEGSGSSVADASGKGHVGTLSSTSWSAAGKFGGALSFNGSSSWVTVADASDLDFSSALTLEAWVRPSVLSGWRTVLFKERPGGIVYSLYANQSAGRPVGQVWLGSELNAVGPAALGLNAWSHVASTYDGSTLRLYVNGALVSSTAVSGTLAASSGVLRIGGNGVWGEWFAGLIDEVRVYNRALSAGEIQTDMNAAVR
ncbi:MAG: hypothetical protein QOE91_1213, partial [Gaiellaceae bacterium]|nr:hypothetical protein [Gaiellaceae bacterium]